MKEKSAAMPLGSVALLSQLLVQSRGAGSYLRSRRFSGFYDRPSKEICQSFENHSEHAQNENVTSNMFRRHFCSGFAFDSINVLFALSTFWQQL